MSCWSRLSFIILFDTPLEPINMMGTLDRLSLLGKNRGSVPRKGLATLVPGPCGSPHNKSFTTGGPIRSEDPLPTLEV